MMNPATGDALERLSRVIKEKPTDEIGMYLLLCMTILANNAPETVHFICDRADERLSDARLLIDDIDSAEEADP